MTGSTESPAPKKPRTSLDDTSLQIIADLVRLHIPARDLVRLQLVSKEWQSWCSENATLLCKTRNQDHHAVRDWFFPTGWTTNCVCEDQPCLNQSLVPCRSWSGFHHPSEQEHLLPTLEFLPDWNVEWAYKLMTSASGLLLFHKSSRTEDKLGELVVCNPLTKTWKTLPSLEAKVEKQICNRAIRRHFHGLKTHHHIQHDDTPEVEFHLVMYAMSNTYTVVLVSKSFICSYKSSPNLNHWVTSKQSLTGFLFGSCLCSDGCIYLLEQVSERRVVAKAFLVESGKWLPDTYTLFDDETYWRHFGKRRTHGPTLVACKGEIYAIVPVGEDMYPNARHSAVTYTVGSLQYRLHNTGTVTFEVFKLHKDRHLFVFCATLPLKAQCDPGWRNWFLVDVRPPGSWYVCVAKGDVIWLACENQVVEYDVLTGLCKTQTSQLRGFSHCVNGDNSIPYEPSFQVIP